VAAPRGYPRRRTEGYLSKTRRETCLITTLRTFSFLRTFIATRRAFLLESSFSAIWVLLMAGPPVVSVLPSVALDRSLERLSRRARP
jgi:hypothetical protein